VTEPGNPNPGRESGSGRLNRTPRRDDGPGSNVHRHLAPIVPKDRLDAARRSLFDQDALRFRVEQEPRARAVRIRKVRDERRLLRVVDASEETEVAAGLATLRISGMTS